ncbi:MAG TPA: mechanosensitive ion channel family protein [Bacteroidia bacterium]|nr:mechanosensitive ion channel family protein [Bacteroidia bacterium]
MNMEMDMKTLDKLITQAIDLGFVIVPKVLLALITYFIGTFIIRLLVKSIKKIFTKYELESSLAIFLSSFLKVFLYVMLFLALAQTLGIQATSFLAVLGAAGLAVGLALQGSLANFAGGVLILIFKPFKVGDIIDAQNTLGEVEGIDILYTKVRNLDNKVVVIPNGTLANSNISNLTAKPIRRVEMSVGVAYGTDLKKTRKVILEALKKDVRIIEDPESLVHFKSFGDSSLDLIVRCWTKTEDFWPVYFDNMETLKEALEEHHIQIPFPQRDVHMFHHDTVSKVIKPKEGIALK